ncbi:MAG: hypothetical protein HY005_02650 [Candidatus Staskawiczbacteria bacterium]|nr:hypothetical protein [Candidatus Staskawiczbacteria bacterium]MBI3337498.1 hypothetical protein [Candidatus Staskawiczbacteria bacterium]
MNILSKKIKGDIAELAVAKRLIELGCKVLFPYGENHRYDLVAEKDSKFLRIQVKYATPKDGILNINCRSSNNWSVLHYTEKEIDILVAYNPDNEEIYFIPVAQINYSSLNLRTSPAKNNQILKINFAENFKELKI